MADTSWRRSPATASRCGGSSTSMVMPCCSAAGRTRSTASATTRCTGTSSRRASSSASMREQLEQVVDRAADPERLGQHPLGQPLGDGRVVLGERASRRAAPSAPTGVFSSWLMLATKSRRTASSRRRSVTSSMTTSTPSRRPSSCSGTAASTRVRRGGPNRSTVRGGSAVARDGGDLGQLGDRLLDERLAVAGGEVARRPPSLR